MEHLGARDGLQSARRRWPTPWNPMEGAARADGVW